MGEGHHFKKNHLDLIQLNFNLKAIIQIFYLIYLTYLIYRLLHPQNNLLNIHMSLPES
jgi:hypothetical protein